MILDTYLQNADTFLYIVLALSAITLLGVYVLRLRRFKLVAKHASWQTEAQAIEVATHDALTANADGNYPLLSIVVPVNEQSTDIHPLLRSLFRQSYKGTFEVVIADENHSADAFATYEEQKREHANLRYTFVPESSRYIELRKLAITLGIKASRGEWVIVVNPETLPMSDEWLQRFAENLGEDVNLAEAYYNYDDDGSLVARRAIFERIDHLSARIYAWERGVVVGCNSANWAVRKKWFIEQNGFADSLNLAFGEEAILANHKVDAENYIMLCSPATRLVEELPSKQTLSILRAQGAEVRRHLSCKARRQQSVSVIANLMCYLFALCLLLYTCIRFYMDIDAETYSECYAYADVIALLLWAVALYLPLRIVRTALHTLDERRYGLYIYFYEMMRPLYSLSAELKRRMYREDFTRKYI